MVEIKTKCKITIWQTFGRIEWHVIPEIAQGLGQFVLAMHELEK